MTAFVVRRAFEYMVLIPLYLVAQPVPNSIPVTIVASDSNLNANWDWRRGDFIDRVYPDAAYRIFHQTDNGAIVPVALQAPWTQANAWSGLLDNRPEDGWILIVRDFGTPTRPITGSRAERPPYFVLYNRYKGMLRIFINVQNTNTWNRGVIEMTFQNPNDPQKTPGLLAYFKPVSSAMDRFSGMSANVSSVVSEVTRTNNWIWADFPMSYDEAVFPKNSMDPPAFLFRVFGQELNDIAIKGLAQGAQGNAQFVNNWLTGALSGNAPLGIADLHMPNLNLNPNINAVSLGSLNLKPFSTQSTWGDFQNYFSKIKIMIPRIDVGNPLKGLYDGYSSMLSKYIGILPIHLPGIDLGGLFDFMVNGGSKGVQPVELAPSFIAMNLELNGTITTTQPLHEVRVTIPSTRDEFWKPSLGSAVGIVRNEPLGVIALKKTPVVLKRSILRSFDSDDTYPRESRSEYLAEYEVAEDLQYAVNPASGLSLESMEAYIFTLFDLYYDVDGWFLSNFNRPNQKMLTEFDSPKSDASFFVRSMPVPVQHLKGRRLHYGKDVDPAVYLKIKAVFKRKDDPSAVPVVLVSTYETEVKDLGRFDNQSYVYRALPVIPPQKVSCQFAPAGGVAVTWEKSKEKSVKRYLVERSINGEAFRQIAAADTNTYTDREVGKAVAAASSKKKNATVHYRVRAFSEWTDFDGSIGRQHSEYSQSASIYGSYDSPLFDKRQHERRGDGGGVHVRSFPNPFNPVTIVQYSVDAPSEVDIVVFNSLGQQVAVLVRERQEPGTYSVEWNASALPSGTYFYRAGIGSHRTTGKMMLLK